MAKVTKMICDNCGADMSTKQSKGFIQLALGKGHDRPEVYLTNDICDTCYDKAVDAVRAVLKPEAFTLDG